MLCSENEIERREGIERIIEIRQNRCEGNLGGKSDRIRKTPEPNPTATNLNEVIAWKNAYEPLCTCDFTTAQLKEYFSKSKSVPDWSCHAQNTERRVKQVTDACDRVFFHEKRDGWIRNQDMSWQLMSKNDSKQDLVKLFSFQND